MPSLMKLSKNKLNKNKADNAYLSYYDVRLTYEDVRTIKKEWLTDNVIAFYEEYLEREELIHYPKSKVVLLRPSMAFMIMSIPDPRSIRDALPDFSATTHVFLPINNNPNPRIAEGGSHWSLLVISLIDKLAFHYDSLDDTNVREAKLVTRNFEKMLDNKIQLRFRTISPCPQQTNHADCGVYVCMYMHTLLFERLLLVNTKYSISMSLRDRQFDAFKGRIKMLKIINEMRAQGLQTQSRAQSMKSTDPPRISDETRGKLISNPSAEWLQLMARCNKTALPAPPATSSSTREPLNAVTNGASNSKRRRAPSQSPDRSGSSDADSIFSKHEDQAGTSLSSSAPTSSSEPSSDTSTLTSPSHAWKRLSRSDKEITSAPVLSLGRGNQENAEPQMYNSSGTHKKSKKVKRMFSLNFSTTSADSDRGPKVKRKRTLSLEGASSRL